MAAGPGMKTQLKNGSVCALQRELHIGELHGGSNQVLADKPGTRELSKQLESAPTDSLSEVNPRKKSLTILDHDPAGPYLRGVALCPRPDKPTHLRFCIAERPLAKSGFSAQRRHLVNPRIRLC